MHPQGLVDELIGGRRQLQAGMIRDKPSQPIEHIRIKPDGRGVSHA
jgi:hypothetical protein